MKSFRRPLRVATFVTVVLASMAPSSDAGSLRGLQVYDEQDGKWASKELNGDSFFRRGKLLGASESAIDSDDSLDEDLATGEDSESLVDLDDDYHVTDTSSGEDYGDRDDVTGSSDGSDENSGSSDGDVNEGSGMGDIDGDEDDLVGEDAVTDLADSNETRGSTGSVKQQTLPTPSPSAPAKTRPAVMVTPIGESAAAAKDIASIDKSAIQRDPTSYGVTTTSPPASATTPPPPPIGESAAAAKDIASIDKSAIQRDPTSYGVVTTEPLNESPAATHPIAPITSSPEPAETNPKQVGI